MQWQRAASLVVEVAQAKAGDAIGVKVPDRCCAGDLVYKITWRRAATAGQRRSSAPR